MSHTVTIFLGNVKKEIKVSCNENIESLKKAISQDYDEKFKNQLIKKMNELENIKKKLLEIPDNIVENDSILSKENNLNIKMEIDHLTKTVSNISSSLSNAEYFFKKYGTKINIVDVVSKYGSIGIQAMNIIEEKKLETTKETLLNIIDEIRNNITSENIKKEYVENINKFIDSQNFENDGIRYELKSIVREYDTPQEMNDAYAYVKAKKVEIENIFDLKNSIFNEIKKLNFIVDENYKANIDDRGLMCLTYKMRNQFGNTIEIMFRGDGSFSYKLGNYVGHACEKTTDKLLNYLESSGFKIAHKTITRNIDNAKPLYKEMKLKFRGE